MPSEGAGTVTLCIGNLKDAGSGGAAAQLLWERYFDQLVKLADARIRRLGAREAVADGEDAAVDAFHSLCLGLKRGRYPRLQDRDDLWRLLVVITRRKVGDQIRAEMAQRRGAGKVVAGEALPDSIDPEPSPEFAAALADEADRLVRMLDSETLRTIARLKLEGLTDGEVAEKVGCTRETVSRKFALIRKKWVGEVEGGAHTWPPPRG
jgi:RNA polymerase sigma factor (sigma-70 family)